MLKKFLYYFAYIKPIKLAFIGSFLSGMVAAASSGLGVPMMISKVFPVVFDNGQLPPMLYNFITSVTPQEYVAKVVLFSACMLMPLVFVVRGVAILVNGYLVNYVGLRVLEGIRLDVFKRLQILPLAFHERQKKGDLISRILTDTQNVQSAITSVSNDLIKQPFTLLSALGFLIYTFMEKGELVSLCINLSFVLFSIIPIYYFGKRVVQKSRYAQKELGNMTAVAQESLASQREIRSYSLEAKQVSMLQVLTKKFFEVQLKTVKYRQMLMPSLEIVSSLGLAYLLIKGRNAGMTLSDFLAVAGALFMAFDAIKNMGVAHNRFKQAQASLERLDAIISEPDTMPDPENPIELTTVRGEIFFNNVSFSYDGVNNVLENINVHIQKGQVVALVGPSGAGKTTFASLILRFYEASSGAICVDGVDVKKVRKKNLREFIALVSQHPILFRNTILENVRMGRLESSDEEVLHAAKLASVTDFAAIQPQGINTMLGETGEGLSGGQRQRVAIARAFLKNAPILILDEATASLDAESEAQIQHELEALVQGRTTFIVAHRFSSIRVADRILVFEKGRIVGDGNHASLYENCALYKELYDKQSIE